MTDQDPLTDSPNTRWDYTNVVLAGVVVFVGMGIWSFGREAFDSVSSLLSRGGE